MKVFELMAKLSAMPAGAEVRIYMLKDLSELPAYDGTLREINFVLQEVELNDNDMVDLDGWTV